MNPVYFPAPPATPHVVHLKSFNHLYDLITPKISWVDKIRGGLASPFVATPAGLAFRDSHLYICDVGQGYVHNWNLMTGKASRLGDDGPLTLETPVAVAVDEDNNVYVADTSRGEVVHFDRLGNVVKRLKPGQGESMKPTALAVRAGKVYVADITTHRIIVFDAASGMLEASFGGPGNELGRFYFPMGIAIANDGQILVSDSMNGRVQRFDRVYKPITAIGSLGDRYGDMGRPRQLCIGPDGVIFVADTEFAHVHMFNKAGQLLMLLGGPEDKLGDTPMPVGIAIANDLPLSMLKLVPQSFEPRYFLFVTNTLGPHRLGLYAIGKKR